jgi:hypothetical protein
MPTHAASGIGLVSAVVVRMLETIIKEGFFD